MIELQGFWPTRTPHSRQRLSTYRRVHSAHPKNYQFVIGNNYPIQSWSLKTEGEMQTIGKMITKHLTGKEELRPFCMAILAYVVNNFASTALLGFLNFELVFACKTIRFDSLCISPVRTNCNPHKNYYNYWKCRIYNRYVAILQIQQTQMEYIMH